MPEPLPHTISQCRDVVWRELLHHGFEDNEYQSCLEAIVASSRAGTRGGVIGAFNGVMAAPGIITAFLVPSIIWRIVAALLSTITVEDDYATQLTASSQGRIDAGLGYIFWAMLVMGVVGFFLGSAQKSSTIFRCLFIGLFILFAAPFFTAATYICGIIFLAIVTVILSIFLIVLNSILGEWLDGETLTHLIWWLGYLAFHPVWIAFAYSTWTEDYSSTEDAWIENAKLFSFCWRGRPAYRMRERALKSLGSSDLRKAIDKIAKADPNSLNADSVKDRLGSEKCSERFIALRQCVQIGGEMVQRLKSVDQDVAAACMAEIAAETQNALSNHRRFCGACAAIVQQHTTVFKGKQFHYWGCRVCNSSRRLTEFKGQLIGTIDPASSSKQTSEWEI